MVDEKKQEDSAVAASDSDDKKAADTTSAPEKKASAGDGSGSNKKDRNKARRQQPRRDSGGSALDSEFEERVVAVNRVAKVVKGGRRFSFSALMIVGDRRGRVGYGLGKAKEVPEAIRKATKAAQRNMVTIPLDRGTIPHEVLGRFDAGKILFRPAAEGTGVKAAGACRAIMELAGVRDILTKSLRGTNPHNTVKATFKALKQLRSVEQIAAVRGKEPKALRIS